MFRLGRPQWVYAARAISMPRIHDFLWRKMGYNEVRALSPAILHKRICPSVQVRLIGLCNVFYSSTYREYRAGPYLRPTRKTMRLKVA